MKFIFILRIDFMLLDINGLHYLGDIFPLAFPLLFASLFDDLSIPILSRQFPSDEINHVLYLRKQETYSSFVQMDVFVLISSGPFE